MATVLVNAGLTTFDKILAMNARDLELVSSLISCLAFSRFYLPVFRRCYGYIIEARRQLSLYLLRARHSFLLPGLALQTPMDD